MLRELRFPVAFPISCPRGRRLRRYNHEHQLYGCCVLPLRRTLLHTRPDQAPRHTTPQREPHTVCFCVLCIRHWFNRVPGPGPGRYLSTLHRSDVNGSLFCRVRKLGREIFGTLQYKFYILLEKDRFRTGWGAVKSCLKSLKILRLWTQPTKSSALGGLQIP